jgi:hypothetical protein
MAEARVPSNECTEFYELPLASWNEFVKIIENHVKKDDDHTKIGTKGLEKKIEQYGAALKAMLEARVENGAVEQGWLEEFVMDELFTRQIFKKHRPPPFKGEKMPRVPRPDEIFALYKGHDVSTITREALARMCCMRLLCRPGLCSSMAVPLVRLSSIWTPLQLDPPPIGPL